MQETTQGEEGRVSSALVRGAVMVLCACVVFFSTKATVWVTRALLRRILPACGSAGAAVRRCHSATWWGPRPPPRTAGTEGPGQPLREPGSPWGTRPGAVAEGQGPGQPRRDPARAPHGSRGEAFGRGHGALALGKSSEGLDALWKHSLLPSCKPFWSLSQGF